MEESLRLDFPFFMEQNPIAYLDNAATTQKPRQVIECVTDSMSFRNANIGRGSYPLAITLASEVDAVRETVGSFIGCDGSHIIFTKGSTEALNMVSASICSKARKGSNVVVTELEHSSNYYPWQRNCRRYDLELRVVPAEAEGTLKADKVLELVNRDTVAVAITGMSNVTGFIPELESICAFARERGVLSVVDASQLAAHRKMDVGKIGCDYLCFSGHKVYGPMGTGVLYAREENLEPLLIGGGAVNPDGSVLAGAEGFEAGTQNISGILGLGSAINYLKQNLGEIKTVEDKLSGYFYDSLGKVPGLHLINEKPSVICSFTMDGLSPYDLGVVLGQHGIAVRTGSCCAYPLMKRLGLEGVCRVSLSFYNTEDEIDRLAAVLRGIGLKYGEGNGKH